MKSRSFRITEPYSLEQFHLIRDVINNFPDATMQVYTSNWYIVIACLDRDIAVYVDMKLKMKGKWQTEIRPGRRNKVRHYIQIKLHRN